MKSILHQAFNLIRQGAYLMPAESADKPATIGIGRYRKSFGVKQSCTLNRKSVGILYADVADYLRLTEQDELGTHLRLIQSIDMTSLLDFLYFIKHSPWFLNFITLLLSRYYAIRTLEAFKMKNYLYTLFLLVVFSLSTIINSHADDENFTGLDLSGQSFQGFSLRRANFSNTNLDNVDFTGANLSDANFSGHTTGENVSFRGARVYGTNFQAANLPGANFYGASAGGSLGPRGTQTRFDSAQLQGANFFGANMRDANFNRASLQNAIFYGSDAKRANFHGANFSGAIITGSDMAHSNFSEANLANASFNGASFSNANFCGVSNIETTRIIGSDFSSAECPPRR